MNAILIGLGDIGLNYDLDQRGCVQTHAKALAVLGFNVLGVDSDNTQRTIAQQYYGFESVSSLAQVPETDNVDLIIIASPTHLHCEHLAWALARQPNVVLLEKPLALSAKDFEKIKAQLTLNLNNASTPKVMVNLIRNYDPFTLQLLSQQPEGCSIQVEYSKSLLHNGIHFLALLLKVFGPVLDAQVLKPDTDSPVVEIKFSDCTALFRPEPSGADNRMRVHSSSSDIEFYNGGRKVLIVYTDGKKIDLENRLSHYQENVMSQVLKLMIGHEDDSLRLAIEAQRLIFSLLSGGKQ